MRIAWAGDGPAVTPPHSPDATVHHSSRNRNDPRYAFLGGHQRSFGIAPE